jgi:uncharacterized membrane protein
MSATFTSLLAATLIFVLGHFLLSAMAVRGALIKTLGPRGFQAAYSVFAIATFVWMNMAFSRAPFEDLWGDPLWARWAAVAVMPLACILFAAGVLTANPNAVGVGEFVAAGRGPVGIQKVTRHPVLWAVNIWAALHLAANGDMASLIFFGGILALGLGGMAHMEARKTAEGGADWARFADNSSAVPFTGLLGGRVTVTLAEIGWGRIAAGVVLYLIFLFGHRLVIDVPLLPGLAG